ncbi:MAG: response regulator transcription factor [Oscillospiraceae bacterium]|nr:response regulator transcription factor [Oscillospiraceae bacterium]
MIKVILIDDEPEIRKILEKMIEKQEGFEVVAQCGSFAEAVTDFTRYKPDVAFVDIDLGGESGLECAKILTELNPKAKIVFATAHSEYMANAFEIYAFDYLVKPFNMERVVRTLKKLRESLPAEVGPAESSGDTVSQSDRFKDKLLIKGKDQVLFVDKKEIIMAERLDGVTRIVTKDEVFQNSASLSDIESKLDPTEFFRCHKSYIINLSCISRIEPYGRWTFSVSLKGCDDTALMTAQNYESLKELFE